MNKKLIMSVATTALALTAIGGATVAYFSDTETSTENKFTSGTIDIAVDGTNPWFRKVRLDDMKPSYKDHIDFVIKNVGTNPANIWKSLTNIETTRCLLIKTMLVLNT